MDLPNAAFLDLFLAQGVFYRLKDKGQGEPQSVNSLDKADFP